jgi:DNA-binding SARP family transcriptional activator/TolB-like protein/tetratricopeptide (TPR) repeat protein
VTSSPDFRLLTLGALRLIGPGGELLAGRRKELALLTYLARRAGRVVSRVELAALFWGERDEEKARQSLRHALLQLRRALTDAIEITNDTARVDVSRVELDASALEADVAAGNLDRAIARWTGDFLSGMEDVGHDDFRAWIEREREGLRRTIRSTFARLVAEARRAENLSHEISVARQWASHFPLDSAASAALIDALLRDGEAESARRAYDAHVASLQSELGAEPPDDFRRLEVGLARVERRADAGSPGSAALLTPEIIGRDAILASLLELWNNVRESPAVVLVESEEGMGKTRLCAELVRRIARSAQPTIVLEGRALPDDVETPWSTLRRWLASLARLPVIEDVPNRSLVELSAILPSLRQRFPHLAEPSGMDGRAEAGLRDVLRVLATRHALLLVVDDAGWADASSRELVLSLMRDLPPATLLVLTARPELTTPLASSLSSTPAARLVKLGPLSRDELARAIDSMVEVSRDDRDRLAERITSESGGNPFYAMELVAAMADSGALTLGPSGRWQIDAELLSQAAPLSASMRATIKTRLARLSEPARSLVTAFAKVNRPVTAEIARQASALTADAFESALDELLSRRLLRTTTGFPPEYELANELLRRIAAEQAASLESADRFGAPDVEEPVRASTRRRRLGAVVAGALVFAVAIAWTVLRPSGDDTTTAIDGPPRVAVLDLALVAPDTNDAYLAAGLSEEITSTLSRFARIRMKSRGAVRSARAVTTGDPAALGRLLHVDYVVEGSLQRVGERLRVAVRLTKTADGFQVWGDDFESVGADLPGLHHRIAIEVAAHIGGRLSPGDEATLRRTLTNDARAYEHYLRGNAFLGRRTPLMVEQAIEQYRAALARDSAFHSARARIAYGYSLFLDWGWRYRDRTRELLLRDGVALVQSVLAVDSTSTDAWLARAYLLAIQDPVGFKGALDAFERAIAIEPSNVEAHYQYGQSLMALGRWNEARAAYQRAIDLEPDRAQTYVSLGSIERKEGNVDLARRLYDSALVVDPGAAYARSARALLRLAAGDVAGALSDAETAVRTTQGYAVPPRAMLAAALAMSGRLAEANREIDAARAAMADPNVPGPTDARWLGSALIAAGQTDEALTLLERTRPRGAWLWFYCTASDFDPVRSHPRFARVMQDARAGG